MPHTFSYRSFAEVPWSLLKESCLECKIVGETVEEGGNIFIAEVRL